MGIRQGHDTDRARSLRACAVLAACLLLAGCFGRDADPATRSDMAPASAAVDTAAAETPALGPQAEVASPLIADLMARRSVLPASGPYADVAEAVLRASAGTSEAELRVARLKARAQSKNWLPKIGPDVSLTSLSSIAAGFVLEQALFDNGRRKAERAYAASDVEVAAIALSVEMNQRVYDGLTYYIDAERAREQAAVSNRAVTRMQDFERIMRIRVEGGLSDGSEAQIVSQKLMEMRATLSNDREAERTALAELAAIAGGPMAGISGTQKLPPDTGSPVPLSVVQVRAEGTRSVAAAEAEKSGLMPSIGLDASLSSGGLTPKISLGGLIGAGSRNAAQALEAATEVAAKRNADAVEDANRRIVTASRQIAAYEARRAEGATVLAQTAKNFETFQAQYKAGRRTLLELVSQYDDYARLERDQASLGYDIAALRLQIARDRGELVDGGRL